MSSDTKQPWEKVLLVPEVAKLLRVSEETIRRLSRQRLLKPLKGIRHLRFTEAEVRRYLAGL